MAQSILSRLPKCILNSFLVDWLEVKEIFEICGRVCCNHEQLAFLTCSMTGLIIQKQLLFRSVSESCFQMHTKNEIHLTELNFYLFYTQTSTPKSPSSKSMSNAMECL